MPEETSEVVVEETAPQDDRIQRVEDFLLDPDKAIFDQLNEFDEAVKFLRENLAGVDLAALQQLVGKDGYSPQIGLDYFTDEDLDGIQAFIESQMPVPGVSYPTVDQVNTFITDEVAKIPRVKGDKGNPGAPGKPGRDGSRDTGLDILEKLRRLPKNQALKIDDVRGLRGVLSSHAEQLNEVEYIKQIVENMKVIIPRLEQNGLQDINGLIEAGTNVVLTGNGTADDPYVINASGMVSVEWGDITGTLADQTDLAAALAAKFDDPTGTTAQYIRGDGSLATFPSIPAGTVTSVGMTVPTGLQVSGSPITASGTLAVTLASGYTIPTTAALAAKLENITSLISAGTNITITGAGTAGSPYVITAAGGASGGQVDSVVAGTGIDVDDTDPVNPEVSLDSATLASLGLADSSLQPGDNITELTNNAGYLTANQTITLSGDITGSGTTSISTAIAAGVIVNADVNASAGIALTKLAAMTANRAVVSDGSGFLVPATTTATEIGYVSGVTSAIQTQLNGKQATLVSGTNIKTINGTTLLGSGDITVATALTVEQSGETPVTGVDHIVFDGATVTDDGSGQVTVEIEGAAGDTIMDLTDLTTVADEDVLPIVDDPSGTPITKRASLTNIFARLLAVSRTFATDLRITAVGTNAASVPTLGSTSTFTNKRINVPYVTSMSNASLTPDLASGPKFFRTTQTTGLTINAPTNAVQGNTIEIRISAASTQTLTMNAAYIPFGAAFPANITGGKDMLITASYNGTNWATLVASQQ